MVHKDIYEIAFSLNVCRHLKSVFHSSDRPGDNGMRAWGWTPLRTLTVAEAGQLYVVLTSQLEMPSA